jgi:hypothetical protein
MAHDKLDMGKAWTQATALIGANRDTISAIAGLFFFLPAFALALFAPELSNPQPAAPAGADPQVAMQVAIDQISQAYADNWALLLALTIAQFVGSLSLLALLSDRGQPTVREALTTGLRSIGSYLAAQLISGLGIALLVGIPLGLVGLSGSPVVIALVAAALILAGIYMFVKFSLIAPVIAIDGERNPIKALGRSWRLTKGNSLRIVIFMVLLLFTIGIIAALVSGIFALVLAAFGSQIATIGTGVVNALVNTVFGVIFLVVIAAVHRQLSGQTPEGLAQTFE